MARRPKGKIRRRKAASSGSTDPRTRLVEAALELAVERSWARIAYGDIARQAGIDVGEALALLPTKTAILAEFQRQLDRAMLQGGDGAEGSARDRLFETLMRRFDALAPHRAALRSIAGGAPLDPGAAVCGWLQLLHSMRLALSVAGCPAEGLPGLVATKGLAGIYLSVLPTFLGDDSADRAATMAALDRRLRCIENAARWVRARSPKAST